MFHSPLERLAIIGALILGLILVFMGRAANDYRDGHRAGYDHGYKIGYEEGLKAQCAPPLPHDDEP